MGAGECRMATEIHLQRRGEPTQVKITIWSPEQKRSLGQVHFLSHLLHPDWIAWGREEAHRSRVASEGSIGEGVYLGELLRAHGLVASARVSGEGSDFCRGRAGRPTRLWR